jgi:pyruvate/2-oxoglutarate/acetoin dehydrogenase E1 component
MARDDRVFLLGEDLRDPWGGTFKVTDGLSTDLGEDRVLNTPISENGIVGLALGSALAGQRPVVELMFMDFVLLALDQLGNQVAKIRYMTGGQVSVPLVVRLPAGGYLGASAQHSQSLEAILAHLPGLLVAAPATPADAKGLLKTAIRLNDPVCFVEHKALYGVRGDVPEGEALVPFGEAATVRPGRDVTMVCWSLMVSKALEVAERLAEDGIEAEVVDIRTLVPLDEEAILSSVDRTGRLVVVQEAPRRNGYGAEIAAMVAERRPGTVIARVAARNTPIPMAPNLEREVLPSVERIVEVVKEAASSDRLLQGQRL